ncbi:MAG TPA: DUF1800 domain-containing protein, partial [Saprospiraceae bacterium]|nr:DUF1800 domain-containing protein [Saprospiraceae bacterium]
PPLIIKGGLDPYAGPWNELTARHLLKRAMFAPNAKQIADAVSDGLAGTLAKLFTPYAAPDLPINYNEANDPNVPIGQSWVFQAVTPNLNYPNRSIRAWQFSLFNNEGVSLREKMVLFWHNHFVTADAVNAKLTYQYIDLIRSQALGNYKQLAKDMTVNSLMLRYLNGAESNKTAPNENYARELLELFTIGKGPEAGPGDYTNYTEQDIKEIARALTGWTIDGAGFGNAGPLPPAIFRPNRHDNGTKQLSFRFNNAVINNLGAEEYKKVIDIILSQDEVSRFMARNLYRWFVYYYIDDVIEANVIEPMAQIMRDNNYEIQPVLEALFSSEHFFSENAIGCQIKSPVDFTASLIKPFDVAFPPELNKDYVIWFALHGLNATLQQDVFTPPNVAGWKAYYQDPVFYRNWISSVTLTVRISACTSMAAGQIMIFDRPFGIDVVKVVDSIDGATDPNILIQKLVDLVLPWPLTQAQLDGLKELLIPGLPDFEWTVEYGQYLNEPTNQTYRKAVENRLRPLFAGLLSLPEFQLQ